MYFLTEREPRYDKVTKQLIARLLKTKSFQLPTEKTVTQCLTSEEIKNVLKERKFNEKYNNSTKQVRKSKKNEEHFRSYFAKSRDGIFMSSFNWLLEFSHKALVTKACTYDDIFGEYGVFNLVLDYIYGDIEYRNSSILSRISCRNEYINAISLLIGNIEESIPGHLLTEEDYQHLNELRLSLT